MRVDTTRSVAHQIADAASAFEQKRTGLFPSAVTVVLSAETLVITLHGALSRAEQSIAKTPEGAAQMREFHRLLFATSSEPLCQEIKRITGAEVCQADPGIPSAAATVVPFFTIGAIVQVFLLSHKLPTETWSGSLTQLGR
jgi:uncharacterized protein YbcI